MPPEGTTYTSAQTITITNNETGSTVYYTLDGTTPNTSSTEYTAPFKLSETKTLKAIAIKGEEKSAVTSATYTINIPDVATLNSIDPTTVNVNTYNRQFTLDATFNSENYTLIWASNDEDLLTVDNQGNYVVNSAEGTVTITVTAQSENEDNFKTVSKDFIVTIIDPNKPGTITNPYTVAQALEFIETLGSATSDDVYVSGIISKIDEINLSYKNATYWISDDGTESNQLEVFRGKYLNNSDFTSQDQIAIGDAVTIFGKLKKFQNTTPEFDQNNYIVAHTGKTFIATDVTVTPTRIPINGNGSFAANVTTAEGITSDDYNITWACTAEDFIVDENTGEYLAGTTTGTFNITVTVTPTQEKSANYKSFSKVIVITVYNPDANDGSLDKAYTVAEVIRDFSVIKNTNGWVKGYLVGVAKNGTINQIVTENISVVSNVILSDSPTETDKDKIIAIGLPNNSVYREALNLSDNENTMKRVLVYVKGTFDDYCSGKGIKAIEDACISTTITSVGYSTTYYGNTALLVPDGTVATTVKLGNDGKLVYTPVADNIIPKATGVVLQGSGEQKLKVVSTTNTAPANDLYGTDISTNELVVGNYNYYKLSLASDSTDPTTVGFYLGAEDGGMFTNGAHKAYMALPKSSASSYVFDETVGVSAIKEAFKYADGIYTLSGMKVSGDHLPKGIYIVNGKKMVIK